MFIYSSLSTYIKIRYLYNCYYDLLSIYLPTLNYDTSKRPFERAQITYGFYKLTSMEMIRIFNATRFQDVPDLSVTT